MSRKHQEGKRGLRNTSYRRKEKTQVGDEVEVELWADRQTDRQTEELRAGVRGLTR
jgi:hypothetical protein